MSASDYDPAHYGETCADFYAQIYSRPDPALVALLASLTGAGSALELGIANGRTALALKRAGVDVHGIDASPSMLAAFRAISDGDSVPLILGDFRSTPLGGPYALVFSICSTLYLLPTVDDIGQCLAHVSAHLHPAGLFLSEAWGTPVTAQYERCSIPLSTAQGPRQYTANLTIPPLDLLDSLASSAGLRLQARWADPSRRAWSPGHQRHLSLYRRD